MHKRLLSSIVLALGLVGCGVPASRDLVPTLSQSVVSPDIPSVTAIATQPAHVDVDATAQATPFDGAPTIEREQCCAMSPTGMTDRLSVRLDAFSIFGPIEAMRVLVELGQDCGGRTPDNSSPRPDTVNAPWEPYSNVPRNYTVPVPQERLRIVAQFRDHQGHIFPTPAGCDDVTGLSALSSTPTR